MLCKLPHALQQWVTPYVGPAGSDPSHLTHTGVGGGSVLGWGGQALASSFPPAFASVAPGLQLAASGLCQEPAVIGSDGVAGGRCPVMPGCRIQGGWWCLMPLLSPPAWARGRGGTQVSGCGVGGRIWCLSRPVSDWSLALSWLEGASGIRVGGSCPSGGALRGGDCRGVGEGGTQPPPRPPACIDGP